MMNQKTRDAASEQMQGVKTFILLLYGIGWRVVVMYLAFIGFMELI